MKKRCRHFQLLEVMIAMFLVALCILPLIQPHLHMYQEQQKVLGRLKRDHAAAVVYADIMKRLYSNEMGWEEMMDRNARHPLNLGTMGNQYEGYYSFEKKSAKPRDEPPAETNYLMKMTIHLAFKGGRDPHDYEYLVFIKRKIKEGQDTHEKVPL